MSYAYDKPIYIVFGPVQVRRIYCWSCRIVLSAPDSSDVTRGPYVMLAVRCSTTCSSPGLYIIDDIHYLRRWGRRRGGRGKGGGACRWMFARLPWQRWDAVHHRRPGGGWALTSWRLLLLLLLALMVVVMVELCSHAPQRRRSSVQTRAAAPTLDRLAAVLTPLPAAPWRHRADISC